jgi:hypothetical protein
MKVSPCFVFIFNLFCTPVFFFLLPFYIICLKKCLVVLPPPINVPSNAPKRARISMSIAGSSSTVVPVSAAASAPVPVASFSSFTAPRLESPVGTEAIGAASGVAPEIIAAQIQQLQQLLQQQQQQQEQQQRASEADVDTAKKECSVSLGHIY